MKRHILYISIIIITFVLISCQPKVFTNDDHNEMLKDLGIDIDNIKNLSDPEGNDLPDNYNPLGKKTGVFNARTELYIVGLSMGGKMQGIFDEEDNFATMMDTWDGDEAWANLPTVSEAGDYDGDGFEEVAIAIHNYNNDEFSIRIIDDKQQNYQKYESVIETVTPDPDSFANHLTNFNIASGDVDGDSNDEILVALGEFFYVIEKSGSNINMTHKLTYPNSTSDLMIINVDSGDTDSDGVDEVVVTKGYGNSSTVAEFYIYDEDFTTPVKTGNTQTTNLSGNPLTIVIPGIEVSDYDGDGLEEVIFFGMNTSVDTLNTLILNDAKGFGGAVSTPYEYLKIYNSFPNSDAQIPKVKTLDIDGDGKKEIATPYFILEDINSVDSQGVIQQKETLDGNISYEWILDTGDVNNDQKEDIVYFNDLGYLTIKGYDFTDSFIEIFQLTDAVFIPNYPYFSMVNIDDDSVIMKYKDEHEVLFTEPQIHAVLASPPYWKQYNQAIDNSETSFGIMNSQGTTYTNEFGFNVGFSIGYHQETPLWGSAGSAQFKVTVSSSFDWSASHTKTIEEVFSYITPAGEDMVVFSAIPFDVYYYEIVSAPPDAEETVGDSITINVPRQIMTTAVERKFYNDNNGIYPDVDEKILVHEIGNPISYMTVTDKESIVNEKSPSVLYSSSMLTVGAGNGLQQVEISEISEQSNGFSYNLNIDAEFEGVGGGVLIGGSVGFHYGHTFETTIGEGTIISGSVGNLDTNDYNTDRAFDWGLISYPESFSDNYEFNVITYWVD